MSQETKSSNGACTHLVEETLKTQEVLQDAPSSVSIPDPEGRIRPSRRRLTAQYKLEILKEIDHSSSLDHVGAILRREGLYSSQVCTWRKARKSGALDALSKKRGRPIKKSPQEKQIEELKAKTKRLQAKLEEAAAIIDIQKKVSEIFGNKIQKD